MNIITADFNWISLLLIVGGAVFSIIKSSSKKDGAKSIGQDSNFETEDEYERIYQERENAEETNKRYTMTENTKQTPLVKEEKSIQPVFEEEENFAYDSTNGEEENFAFDIRQAIIGSEILRRPNY